MCACVCACVCVCVCVWYIIICYVGILFIGLLAVNTEYQVNLGNKNKSDKAMFATAWKVEELKQLCAECRSLCTELNITMDLVRDPDTDFQQSSIPRRLTDLRRRLSALVKAAYKYRRNPASHVFVFMISPEQCNQKPYALPVQYIPCSSLKESEIRQLTTELVAEMVKRRMNVVGKCRST